MKSPVNSLRLLWVVALAILTGGLTLLNISQGRLTKIRASINSTPLVSVTSRQEFPRLNGKAAIEHLQQQGHYASLSAAMEAARYQIEWRDQALPGHRGAYQAANDAQSLRAYFTPEEMRLAASDKQTSTWQTGMRLIGYGYGDQLVPLAGNKMSANGNQIEYERHSVSSNSPAIIKEWYINHSSGIEQGFTLAAPPGAKPKGAQLRLALKLLGDLRASLKEDGQALALSQCNGAEMLRYDKLHAFDARGKDLSARMELSGDELSLVVDDTNAVYPVTIDPLFTQQAKLTINDGAFLDQLGYSVAMSGDTVVVGANLDDVGANTDQGSAYVFVRTGTTWSLQQQLIASDGTANDIFGTSVTINSDTIVVGARQDDVGTNTDQGSAYVFVRSGTTWSEQQKLTGSDGGVNDFFGTSVAISGDTIVVGAMFDSIGANSFQGSAYVFVRSGTTWSEQQKLTASDGTVIDIFGNAVAISGDTIVVGAYNDDVGTNTNQGSAYVFVRSGTTWTEQQKLSASDGGVNDQFGQSVSVSGDTIVVGAFADAVGANSFQGSAYIFVRSGTAWSEQQKLTASDGTTFDFFGYSVAISDDTVVVSAHWQNVGANPNQGSAYVFVRSGTSWSQQQKLTACDGITGALFGYAVAISGDSILIGVPIDQPTELGAAYVFTTAVNNPPNAVDDSTGTNEGTAVTLNVLANDTAPSPCVTLSVTGVTQGGNGSVTNNGDGTVTYAPNTDFSGTDSFTYTITGSQGGTDTATVTVIVNGINDPPDAVDDIATTNQNTAVTIPVLANDTDIDGNTLTISNVTQGANGAVVINANGTVTYTPNANFNGADSFAYTISDGNGETDTATVAVTINAVNIVSNITVSAPSFIANGGNVAVSAVLTGVANAPLSNRTVTFSIGTGAATQSCTAMTSNTGLANCTIANVNQPLGPGLPVLASFAGDENYLGSSASTTTLVFAYAVSGGGGFAIGDQNASVGTVVTFWGAKWAKENSLSEGAAPSAFKGFANKGISNHSNSTPIGCGNPWFIDPGNSSDPPASIPSYMAVIVTSKVTKSGSTISGNTTKVVVVRTNLGYAANPGHAGTGTVVGILCQ